MAIASMVLGIIGLCPITYGLVPLLAVIFGHVSMNSIKKSGGLIVGRGMAKAGLVLGYLGLALTALLLIAAYSSP